MLGYLICALTMSFICILVNFLHERPSGGRAAGGGTSYTVKPPSALKYVYLGLFLTAIFLFSFFFFLRVIGNPTATIGHLRAFLVIAGIGLLVMTYASFSRLCVSEEGMELHRLFRLPRKLMFSEVADVKVGKKGKLIIFAGGRVFCTVDLLSDNYDLFFETLENKGLLKKREHKRLSH